MTFLFVWDFCPHNKASHIQALPWMIPSPCVTSKHIQHTHTQNAQLPCSVAYCSALSTLGTTRKRWSKLARKNPIKSNRSAPNNPWRNQHQNGTWLHFVACHMLLPVWMRLKGHRAMSIQFVESGKWKFLTSTDGTHAQMNSLLIGKVLSISETVHPHVTCETVQKGGKGKDPCLWRQHANAHIGLWNCHDLAQAVKFAHDDKFGQFRCSPRIALGRNLLAHKLKEMCV